MTADRRLRVIHLRQQHVGKAGPDQVVQEELPVVRAARPDLAEPPVEGVEPGRWLRRPGRGLQDRERPANPVNAFDDGRPDVGGELVPAARRADERERRVLRDLGRASPGRVRPLRDGGPEGRFRSRKTARAVSGTARRRRSVPRWTRPRRARSGTPARHGCGRRRRDARGSAARASWPASAATLPATVPPDRLPAMNGVESDAAERRARRDEIPWHVVTEIAPHEHDRGRCRPRTERASRCGTCRSATHPRNERSSPDQASDPAPSSSGGVCGKSSRYRSKPPGSRGCLSTCTSPLRRPVAARTRESGIVTPSPFQTPAGTRSASRLPRARAPVGRRRRR